MSRLTIEELARLGPHPDDRSRERNYYPPERSSSWGPESLLLGGLLVVGLGVLAWTYLGPDLIRYIKIRNM